MINHLIYIFCKFVISQRFTKDYKIISNILIKSTLKRTLITFKLFFNTLKYFESIYILVTLFENILGN